MAAEIARLIPYESIHGTIKAASAGDPIYRQIWSKTEA